VAAITEMCASVTSTAETAANKRGLTEQAKSHASARSVVMNEARDAMDVLVERSREIPKITAVIDDIAF
jgi:methyl-accepting chemotaxis protein